MKYMILIYADDAAWEAATPAAREALYDRHRAYIADLAAAGVMRGGSELGLARTATTLRMRGGRLVATDGPYAETREQLGGYYLIETADLDQALHWASRCPNVDDGAVEVRPLTDNGA